MVYNENNKHFPTEKGGWPRITIDSYVDKDMISDTEKPRKLFCSYHTQTIDGKEQGFGNGVFEFNPLYTDLDKFIVDLQKSLEISIEQMTKKKVTVRILYFRWVIGIV